MGIRFLFIVPWAQGVSSGPCWTAHLTSNGNTHLQWRFRRMHSLTEMSISLTERLSDEEPEIVTSSESTLSHSREDGRLRLSEGGIATLRAPSLECSPQCTPHPTSPISPPYSSFLHTLIQCTHPFLRKPHLLPPIHTALPCFSLGAFL